jgi:hypothetical protein
VVPRGARILREGSLREAVGMRSSGNEGADYMTCGRGFRPEAFPEYPANHQG